MPDASRSISAQGLADLAIEEGAEIDRAVVARHEEHVNDRISVELTQEQFDALVSYVFNLGWNALDRSGLAALINAGEWRSNDRDTRIRAIGQIWAAFTGARHTSVDDFAMGNLTSRRRREAEKFLRAAYAQADSPRT